MAEKDFHPEDPMELVGVSLSGAGPQAMAECLVEEYIREGFDDASLLRLFRDPFYRATHRIYREKGEEHIRNLIAGLRRKWGMWNSGDAASRLRMDDFKKGMLKEGMDDA